MRSQLYVCGIALISSFPLACNHDAVAPAHPRLEVRNLRGDTIATLHLTGCMSAQIDTTDYLPFRDAILPGTNRVFAPNSGCWDAEFFNSRDSSVDARNHIVLADGDSLVVLLSAQ